MSPAHGVRRNSVDRQAHAGSWWAASARHACAFPALAEDIETDVAIIGAGFTGLSAAHHLQRMGRSCTVLDANDVGWGASGRNGGIAVPRYKLTYPELEKKYGAATAVAMYRTGHEAVDTLEGVVNEHALECDFSRSGHITPVLTRTDVERFTQDVAWLHRHLGDDHPRMLDRAQVAQKLGTNFYTAGYHEPRAAAIHPLEYCRSLANALAGKGVRVFCGTPASHWESSGEGLIVHTPRGRVKARTLVLGTNAYSSLSAAGSRVEKRVVPVASAVLATEPLPSSLLARVLPDGECATDAKRLTNYYRVLRDGSFFFGGRGGAASEASQRNYDGLRRDMLTIFPELADVPVRHQWFGLVAVTTDSLPHIGSLAPNVQYAMGYNGRGVALAALLGKEVAELCTGRPVSLGPMSEGRFNPIPFHAFRVPAKQVVITWKQLLDALGW